MMRNYIHISTKDVKQIIQATFPGYRKRKVTLVVTDSVTFTDLNWSGGTRSQYRACDIDGHPLDLKHNLSGPPPWDNPFEGLKIDLPESAVIVKGGHFCGKPSTLYIYVHPNNIPKQLKED